MNNDTFSANVIDGAVSLLKKQKPKLKSDHDSASIVYMHPDSLECLGIPPEDADMIRAQLDEDGECKYNQAVFVRVDRENHSTSAEPQDAPGSPEVGVPSSQHSD